MERCMGSEPFGRTPSPGLCRKIECSQLLREAVCSISTTGLVGSGSFLLEGNRTPEQQEDRSSRSQASRRPQAGGKGPALTEKTSKVPQEAQASRGAIDKQLEPIPVGKADLPNAAQPPDIGAFENTDPEGSSRSSESCSLSDHFDTTSPKQIDDVTFDLPRDTKFNMERMHGTVDVAACENLGSAIEGSCVKSPDIADLGPISSKDLKTTSLSYPKWYTMLVPLALQTRSAFSSYLSRTIRLSHLPRQDKMTPTFFPIPIPTIGAFGRMPAKHSKTKHARSITQTVHAICMALNFWYTGGRFGELSLLQRKPSRHHELMYSRLRLLCESEGSDQVHNLPSSGRRFPELVARLGDLSEMLTKIGISSDPYDKTYQGAQIDTTHQDEIRPYQDMNPERLKLFGKGEWDVTEFLDDSLCMAYREPKALLHGLPADAGPQIRDSPETLSQLAKKWDELGLLMIHDKPVLPGSLVRIFGAMKDQLTHRQIGDKRGRNALESKVLGPSKDLPSGSDFCELHIDPQTERLSISITDRKDFYHQIKATESKAISNTIGPCVPIDLLKDTHAYTAFLLRSAKKKYLRDKVGDDLGTHSYSQHLEPEAGCCWVSFASILQGDHAGVEIATQAHTSMLQDWGLLHEDTAMVARKPLRSQKLAQGLVIDDFFAVSIEPKDSHQLSKSAQCYEVANLAYTHHKLLGSPQKDLVNVDQGRVIGAFINGGERAQRGGMVTVASPPAKRLALAYLCMQIAKLPYTTDSLHLCLIGGIVSAFNYRRPMMGLLQDSFGLVDIAHFDRDHPRLIPLPRNVANELTLVACLMNLAVTDIAVGYEPHIFCTDASNEKGAALRTAASPELVEVMWKTGRSKGAYSRLLTPLEATLKNLDALEELPEEDKFGQAVDRPLAFRYDFVEVFSGASLVTAEVSRLGFVTGPPIDLSLSPEFDMSKVHVVAWLTSMVQDKRLAAFFLSPPCTTFSIMRRPRLRTPNEPFGIDPKDPQTRTGTLLACRAMQLMKVGAVNAACGISETPYSSYMKWLPSWQCIRDLPTAAETRTDSCQFGSIHLKSFRFLGINLHMEPLQRRCKCTGKHVQVQGKYTKSSATYTQPLAQTIARVLAKGILEWKAHLRDLEEGVTKGLESQLVNEVMQTSEWKLVKQWTFRKKSHINILEESALLKLCSILARRGMPRRIVICVDSHVVRCATSKGRTSSYGLAPVLRRVSALAVAAGLYISVPFCPTRLNCADDPTRNRTIRKPTSGLGIHRWDREMLFDLAEHPKLRRWASNWSRLVIRLLGYPVLQFADRSKYRQLHSQWFSKHVHDNLEFDSTMGFPGEGPSQHRRVLSVPLDKVGKAHTVQTSPLDFSRSSLIVCAPVCVSCFRPGSLWGARVLLFCLLCFTCLGRSSAMPINPSTPAENRRHIDRMTRPELQTGRPVTEATRQLRDRYWSVFESWTHESGFNFEEILADYYGNLDEINFILVRFGRTLYRQGKSYNQYAETLNALVARRPALRRLLTAAWDLGFAWTKQEPSQHHIPMPIPILLSMITTALFWGWLRMAGILALGFGGLLRPGELVSALRMDLLLPTDVGNIMQFALLSIREPKSRYTYARHQATKIDSPDLLQVVTLAFKQLRSTERLWPYSGQTLRGRFKALLAVNGLSTISRPGNRCLDLGSLRSGGATFIILTTENSELCRRRGRWANHRMMEVYVQETMAIQYMSLVSGDVRARILQVARGFNTVLQRCTLFVASGVPEQYWFSMLSRWQSLEGNGWKRWEMQIPWIIWFWLAHQAACRPFGCHQEVSLAADGLSPVHFTNTADGKQSCLIRWQYLRWLLVFHFKRSPCPTPSHHREMQIPWIIWFWLAHQAACRPFGCHQEVSLAADGLSPVHFTNTADGKQSCLIRYIYIINFILNFNLILIY